MKKEGDRYLNLVEWSEEDGCYVGTCPESCTAASTEATKGPCTPSCAAL